MNRIIAFLILALLSPILLVLFLLHWFDEMTFAYAADAFKTIKGE